MEALRAANIELVSGDDTLWVMRLDGGVRGSDGVDVVYMEMSE